MRANEFKALMKQVKVSVNEMADQLNHERRGFQSTMRQAVADNEEIKPAWGTALKSITRARYTLARQEL